MKQKYICPKCHQHTGAEIFYGMPAFSPQLAKDLAEGYLVLGGCEIFDDNPDRRCTNCGHEWRVARRKHSPFKRGNSD